MMKMDFRDIAGATQFKLNEPLNFPQLIQARLFERRAECQAGTFFGRTMGMVRLVKQLVRNPESGYHRCHQKKSAG